MSMGAIKTHATDILLTPRRMQFGINDTTTSITRHLSVLFQSMVPHGPYYFIFTIIGSVEH